ncbi:peptidylglycine alpha-amidating monooxygenase, putative [alpha proteobacterium BAL199]|jgi:DNA-binding beta-propeller fold protein YncE|nr:peptidylglycine alpha-amidating monooxygenase, putative [alpha proteobacterium BAL199]
MSTSLGNEGIVTALGDRRYRIERGWARLPDGMYWGMVSQLAASSDGRLFVLQRTDPPVVVFGPDGTYVAGLMDRRIVDGHAIHIDRRPDGTERLFIVDRDAHEVVCADLDGRVLFTLGTRNTPAFEAPFNSPTDVTVAPDGEIYVSDGYGNTRVHRFSASGEHLGSWGALGTRPGAFITPHAITIDHEDRVLVADRENNRVQVFDRDGRVLAVWEGMHKPMDVVVDDRGLVLISDQVPRIHVLRLDGSVAGRGRAAINGAHGMSVGPDGAIYLAELAPETVTRLTPVD